MSIPTFIKQATSASTSLIGRIPSDFVHLSLRVGLAGIFWMSARTKVTGLLTVSDTTFFLFQEEYSLPFISADIAAPLTTYAEHLFPILLLVGFASRLSALALFIMTLVIQLFVYPAAFWSAHAGWFAMALAIMHFGPGRWSLDHVLARKAKPESTDGTVSTVQP